MDREELKSRIDAFDRWHYRFDFGEGLTTPIWDETRVNRHEQRYRYFFEPLLQLTGGSLSGYRVLDLGCNAGWWSLKAIEAGADYVFGIDGRQMHIDQSNLVFEGFDVDSSRYRFDTGNIFDYQFTGQYDLVLCLGLMYHIAKPVDLFEVMSRVEPKLIVIDTEISTIPGEVFEIRHDLLDDPRNAVEYDTVFYPSRQAIVALANQYGYQTAPLRLNMTNWTGVDDYKGRSRVAFVCSRGVNLDALAKESPPLAVETGVRGDFARIGERTKQKVANILHRI